MPSTPTGTSSTSDQVQIDTSSFAKFAKDLKRVDEKLAKDLNRNLRAAGELVAAKARANASWSSRIPQSIKVRRSSNAIKVLSLRAQAPEARPLEHGGQPGTFRHPVFGDREVWVSQPARPFLHPALIETGPAAVLAAKKAVESALREVHSHG